MKKLIIALLVVLGFILISCEKETEMLPNTEIETINSQTEAQTITVTIDKPKDIIKKTDNLKIMGDIGNLEVGKSYVLTVTVVQINGSNYSPQIDKYFSVEP